MTKMCIVQLIYFYMYDTYELDETLHPVIVRALERNPFALDRIMDQDEQWIGFHIGKCIGDQRNYESCGYNK